MQNRLFDSILRTSGADTDDIHSGEAEGNFWATGCEIGQIFEAVLREAHLQEMAPVKGSSVIKRILAEIKSWKVQDIINPLAKFKILLEKIRTGGTGGTQGFMFVDENENEINRDLWGQNIVNGLINKIRNEFIDPLKKALTSVFNITFRD